MYLAASLVAALVFALVLNRSISKHPGVWYAVAVLLGIFEWIYYDMGLRDRFPEWFTIHVMNLLIRGAFATALFVLVMFVGVLNSNWTVTKKLRKIRREMSVIACYLTLGHNFMYGEVHFVQFFTNPGTMEPQYFIAAIISLTMIVIMLVLMITSFKFVRRKMKVDTWRRIHRWAYVFFGLIYVHIMVLFIPEIHEKWLSVAVYTVVFAGYLAARVYKRSSVKARGADSAAEPRLHSAESI